jgi:hypothetical protein
MFDAPVQRPFGQPTGIGPWGGTQGTGRPARRKGLLSVPMLPSPVVRFAARVLLLCSIALFGMGCASKPTMKLNHAEITGVRITFPPNIGVLMKIYVDVYNPNSYDVAIRSVGGQVVLNNRFNLPVDFRADGDGLWLNSKSTTSIAVPVSIPAAVALAILGETLTSPTIPYHFMGRANVTATRTFEIEKDDYSVDEQGSISRQQIDAAIRLGSGGAR